MSREKFITPEYRAWTSMKSRCSNKNVPIYPRYGGRGISVCSKWQDSFETFLKDMGKRPSKYHSIDRIDNDKGYSKENCKWSTQTEQANNTSRNILYLGETAAQASARLGGSRKLVESRIRNKWSLEDAFTVECTTKYNDGESASKASKRLGGNPDLITKRISRGWSVERAFTERVKK